MMNDDFLCKLNSQKYINITFITTVIIKTKQSQLLEAKASTKAKLILPIQKKMQYGSLNFYIILNLHQNDYFIRQVYCFSCQFKHKQTLFCVLNYSPEPLSIYKIFWKVACHSIQNIYQTYQLQYVIFLSNCCPIFQFNLSMIFIQSNHVQKQIYYHHLANLIIFEELPSFRSLVLFKKIQGHPSFPWNMILNRLVMFRQIYKTIMLHLLFCCIPCSQLLWLLGYFYQQRPAYVNRYFQKCVYFENGKVWIKLGVTHDIQIYQFLCYGREWRCF